MTAEKQKSIVWAIRIIVSALFILSAYAKLHPDPTFAINIFEVKYLGSMGITGAFAKLMSRFIIGLEFAIAIMIMLPYYVKKVVFPLTIAILGAFSLHLILQVFGGISANCGCFGELIPMTPIQALIKNIVTILLLLVPLLVYKDALEEKKNLSPVIIVSLACWLAMFAFIPQKSGGAPIKSVNAGGEEVVLEIDPNDGATYFADAKKGHKLLCFFSPTCDHCMETGKKLTELKAQFPTLMPDIRILFMDEADNGSPNEIKYFFEFIGAEYEYQVLSIEAYIPIFFADYNFPGVKYLHNGEEKIFFEGTEGNEFDADKLMEVIQKEQ